MPVPYQQVSRTAARSLEEFDSQFRRALALGDIVQWAVMFGYMVTTNALKMTWPLPLDAAGYKELKGDMTYRRLYLREINLVSKEWQDGVAEKAAIVEAPDFVAWSDQPAIMAEQWQRQPNKVAAEMLALDTFNGPLLDLYRDPDVGGASTKRMFASDHLHNVLKATVGTFSNTLTTTVADIESGAVFDTLSTRFRQVKGANGDSLGLRLGSFLVPPTREMNFVRGLEPERTVQVIQNVAGTENVAATERRNLHRALTHEVADELKSEDYFYAMAQPKAGMYPWVMMTKGAPEKIEHDKSSDMYKRSREIAVGYIGDLNVGAALPHPIIRVQITG